MSLGHWKLQKGLKMTLLLYIMNESKGLLGLFSRVKKHRGFHVFKKEIRKASCPRLQVFKVRKCPSRHKPGVHTNNSTQKPKTVVFLFCESTTQTHSFSTYQHPWHLLNPHSSSPSIRTILTQTCTTCPQLFCLCLPILLQAVQHDRKLLGSSVQHWCESQWAVLLPNVFSSLKTRAESNDETPWTGTWGGAGHIQCAKKQSRFFCLCVDAPCMCKFDHSFLLHPKSKCPLFSPTKVIWIHSTYLSNLEFDEEGEVKFFQTLKFYDRPQLHQLHNQNGGKFSFHNQIPNSLQKDSGWSCLQHEQAWFLKQMDLTCLLGSWVAAPSFTHLG